MGINAVAPSEASQDADETAETAQERVSCVSAPLKTALYRHFDSNGRLLYVGISLSPVYRLSQHCDGAQWADRIATVTIEWLPSRIAALAAERQAVALEKPECNIRLQVTSMPQIARCQELADESRGDLTRYVARFRAAYTPDEAARAAEVGTNAMRLALWNGEVNYYVVSARSVAISGWALIEFIEALEAGSLKVRRLARLPDGTYERLPTLEQLVARKEGADLKLVA